MYKFPERLKKLRKEKGLSQNGLAKATGFNQSAIMRWENYKSVPKVRVLRVLIKFFDVSADYLLGLED